MDSTPVECGRSHETTRRSQLAGWPEYGYCASRSRFFWGLRLHLVCTLGGLPVAFALTGAKADERHTLLGILTADPHLAADRPGQTMIADRNNGTVPCTAELWTPEDEGRESCSGPAPKRSGNRTTARIAHE